MNWLLVLTPQDSWVLSITLQGKESFQITRQDHALRKPGHSTKALREMWRRS